MEKIKNFYDYEIDNKLKRICQIFGYLKPSEVQKSLIEQVLIRREGDIKDFQENILLSSKAGSGKTFCYLLYLLNKIEMDVKKLQAVILVPTRELAMQTVSYFDKINRESVLQKDNQNIESDFEMNKLSSECERNININYKLLIGGRDFHDKNRHDRGIKNLIDANTQVVVGTLGKIYKTFSSLLSNKNAKKESLNKNENSILENFSCFIIDEADKVMNQNKTGSLEKLLKLFLKKADKNSNRNIFSKNHIYSSNLFLLTPAKIRASLVLSSASFDKRSMNFYMNYVDDLMVIKAGTKLQKISDDDRSNNIIAKNIIKPLQINSQTEILENLKEYYHIFKQEVKSTYYEQKYQKLFELLNFLKSDFKQCLIFYNQKGRGEELASDLRDFGWSTTFIHGDLTQDQRILIYEKIKNIQVKIILATDLFSRGIDLSTIDLVINFDMPYNTIEYYHRVGRTGRYNSYGVSVTFLNENEKKILEEIESNFNLKNESNNLGKYKITELPQLNPDAFNLLKEDLKIVQEKNVLSQDIQNKVKSLDLEIKTECDKESEYLNKKRRRTIQYEKESLISEWVEPDTKLFEVNKFRYYEELTDGGNEIKNEIQEHCEGIKNICEFCLYCNLFKIFDFES